MLLSMNTSYVSMNMDQIFYTWLMMQNSNKLEFLLDIFYVWRKVPCPGGIGHMKQKRSDEDVGGRSNNQLVPVSKKVCFEKHYPEGSSYRCYGLSMHPLCEGEDLSCLDFVWYYFCEAQSMLVPLPVGFAPILKDEEGDDNP